MNKTTKWIVIGIVALIAIWAFAGYNGMVSADEDVTKAWNNVQSDYQRRADLIPNLVETTKEAAKREQGILEAVVNARAEATSVQLTADELTEENLKKFQQAQSELSSSLSRLLMSVEAYPELESIRGYGELRASLEGTENRIKESRNAFNETVAVYNKKVRSFPNNLIAGMFGFSTRAGFTAAEGADQAPKVDFSE
ncbi:MAG: LemA family protein [Paludibacteraceae bacterium]|nr:LemA family protein [Paludibacteraceae bacterium]